MVCCAYVVYALSAGSVSVFAPSCAFLFYLCVSVCVGAAGVSGLH